MEENKKKIKEKPKKENLNELDLISELKQKIEDLERKNAEVFSNWQRAEANFLNYKNTESERINEFGNRIKENILEELLPIVDNFNLAEKAIPEDKKSDNNIIGLLLIKKQLDYFLTSIGIEEINVLNLPFNPNLGEVVEEIEIDGQEGGIVVEEVQKGYQLKGKVIRAAKVKISK